MGKKVVDFKAKEDCRIASLKPKYKVGDWVWIIYTDSYIQDESDNIPYGKDILCKIVNYKEKSRTKFESNEGKIYMFTVYNEGYIVCKATTEDLVEAGIIKKPGLTQSLMKASDYQVGDLVWVTSHPNGESNRAGVFEDQICELHLDCKHLNGKCVTGLIRGDFVISTEEGAFRISTDNIIGYAISEENKEEPQKYSQIDFKIGDVVYCDNRNVISDFRKEAYIPVFVVSEISEQCRGMSIYYLRPNSGLGVLSNFCRHATKREISAFIQDKGYLLTQEEREALNERLLDPPMEDKSETTVAVKQGWRSVKAVPTSLMCKCDMWLDKIDVFYDVNTVKIGSRGTIARPIKDTVQTTELTIKTLTTKINR